MINNNKITKAIIYALVCPFTNEVHYIGKSTQGVLRPLSHINSSHSDKVNEWVDELKKLGHTPIVKILEYVNSNENIFERENFWIDKYNKDNLLLNKTHVSSCLVNTKLNTDLQSVEYKTTDRIRFFIKQKRKLLKLTQPELARKSGVGLRFIRELEQGNKTSLNIGKIQQILNLFGCMLEVVPITKEFRD